MQDLPESDPPVCPSYFNEFLQQLLTAIKLHCVLFAFYTK